ncbi:hypothetical protein AVEN_240415-1 [Araneus ventricosus]|uniref:Uncharacterized protein n=1 Tax=Araneus ventricosus TaxID=182803 RepID=A0A4Y2GYU7_ARAVE|nr:hypothetical protein AVEN_240415-1 [Araneus ventricosus]
MLNFHARFILWFIESERQTSVPFLLYCIRYILLQTWKVASQQCDAYSWEDDFTGTKRNLKRWLGNLTGVVGRNAYAINLLEVCSCLRSGYESQFQRRSIVPGRLMDVQ